MGELIPPAIPHLNDNTRKRIFVADTRGEAVWTSDLDHMSFTRIPVNFDGPIKATYNHVDKRVYVANSKGDSPLTTCTLSGSSLSTLLVGTYTGLTDIALAERHQRLFAVFKDSNVIVVYYLPRRAPQPFVSSVLSNPRAVHVVESQGHVYFTHDNTIERIDISGSNRQVIVTLASSLRQSNSLTVDVESDRLFLIDGDRENIISVNLDGSDMNMSFLPENTVCIGITSFGGLLYWSDENSVVRISKTIPGSDVTTEGEFVDAAYLSIV
ncbi:protein cueball-like [Diadema antillarum]|uniref:protein cueball-like n=1 Tax=Diadema antillarum TaxID=105358 RepID=UPI003A8B887B